MIISWPATLKIGLTMWSNLLPQLSCVRKCLSTGYLEEDENIKTETLIHQLVARDCIRRLIGKYFNLQGVPEKMFDCQGCFRIVMA